MHRRTVDLGDFVEPICERLGLNSRWIYRLDLDYNSGTATAYLYKGDEGFCAGKKYLIKEGRWAGEPALEQPLVFMIA